MIEFDKKTKILIAEYHHYHGDFLAEPIREIHHPDGGKAILVHFIDGKGVMYSSLDMIAHDKDGEYVTELFSSERANENDMIQTYLEL